MNRIITSLAAAVLLSVPAWAQVRTQTVVLEKGWNAVWLEVEPTNPAPAAVFADIRVDIAAGYVLPVSHSQFVKNTAVNVQALAGWNIWYAPGRADAPLTRLGILTANTGYLVHALDDAVLTVTGTMPSGRVRWTPDRFNLVGFGVSAQGAPTFAQFFAGSAAHRNLQIYRLVGGTWRRVQQPANETLRAGEAFWAYSDGASDWQGPLAVKGNSGTGLLLANTTKGDLVLSNAAAYPLTVTLETVTDGGFAALPLAALVRTSSSAALTALTDVPVPFADGGTQDIPTLEAGTGVTLPLVLRVNNLTPGIYRGLLKATTDIGTETYIPVYATCD